MGLDQRSGGTYTVKLPYDLLLGEVFEPPDKKILKLWGIRAPSNVICLACKVLLNHVQSKENLEKKKGDFTRILSNFLFVLLTLRNQLRIFFSLAPFLDGLELCASLARNHAGHAGRGQNTLLDVH